MINSLPPGLILIVGALFAPARRGNFRGQGVFIDPSMSLYFVVCRYQPPGNWVGKKPY